MLDTWSVNRPFSFIWDAIGLLCPKFSIDTESKIKKAIAIRDQSLVSVDPPLRVVDVPKPLPLDVTHIPKAILSKEELRITSLDPGELLEEIRSKRVSCVEVTRAFLRRAALAQDLVNCITELLPKYALERAEYLDSLEKPIGPLHGLPISVKEHHGMRGCITNCAFVSLADSEISDTQSGVNDVLWAAGAVFYARTTQPQSLMHLETSSIIYGVTVNPHNRNLTPGGSSGGESALIAIGGSILGIGGDSGGSIRVPAANTGIYGFKPTSGRLTRRGTKGGTPRGDGISGSHGPLSSSRSGLELLMKTCLESEPWLMDPSLVPLPWRRVVLPQTLKIAIMWSDGVVQPHPPVIRALKEMRAWLEVNPNRFKVVEWVPLAHDKGWEITQALYYEDGGVGLLADLAKGGEEPLPLTRWMLQSDNVRARTTQEAIKLKIERNEYCQAYSDHWRSTAENDGQAVDAILCPVGPGAAPPLGHSKYWSYTSQWNLLDYPAAVFPVTKVDQHADKQDTTYHPRNPSDKFNYDLYDPQIYVNAPVGLQLVTRRYEDEKCLAILGLIEKAMGRE